jgi:hypothetical protein
MKLENHLKKLKEHVNGLEWGIRQNNHSAIGFHASQGAVEIISIYLHKLKLIPADIQIKHIWFRSRGAMETKFDFSFPKKNEILSLAGEIEDARNSLCYGAPKPEETVEGVAGSFRRLKSLIEKELGEKFD